MKKKTIIILISIICGVLLIGSILYLFLFTDLFIKKIIPKVDKIEISYVPGLDYNQALEKNKDKEKPIIETANIKMKELEQKEFISLINRLNEKAEKKEFEVLMTVKINKDIEIDLGKKITKITINKKTTYYKTTKKLYNKVTDLIENNNKKILNDISFEKFVFKKDGAVITLTNKDNLKIVKQALPHYKISIEDNYVSYEGGYSETVIINENTYIYLYSSKIGYVKTPEESYYAIFPYDLQEAINKIYKASI